MHAPLGDDYFVRPVGLQPLMENDQYLILIKKKKGY